MLSTYKNKKRIFTVFLFIIAFATGLLIGKLYFNKKSNAIVENTVFDDSSFIEEEIIPEPLQEPAPQNIPSEIKNLVNIQHIDSEILVELKYATSDNFTGIVLYEGIEGAYLQADVAQMLAKAQRFLRSLHPELRLLVYDAARPLIVQRKMWERVKDTPYHRYVANPARLSVHNFGSAVDLTIADSFGQPLDMGTSFDHFGRAAAIVNEGLLIEQGVLNKQQVTNRQLLRRVMHHAGFRSISGEWWHFNACSLQEAKRRYELIEDF